MSPLTFQIFKWVFTVATIGYICVEFNYFLTRSWTIRLIVLMALCYPLGKAIEFWVIGPEIVRGHLSDFGFVPCFAYYLTKEAPGPLRHMSTWHRWLVTATGALVVAAGVEIVELIGQRLEIAKHAPTRGDWWDMACYFLSYGLILVLARRQVTASEKAHSQRVEFEQAAEQADFEGKRTSGRALQDRPRNGRRPSRKPSRRKNTMGPRGRSL